MRWVLVLTLAACGRVDFAPIATDAPSDTVLGHDEDGDGLADAVDPCPYTPGDAADSDGDGVGDACDPHPMAPSEHWALFSPCTPDAPPPLTAMAPFTQNADSIRATGFGEYLSVPIATARIGIGFTIHARIGTGQHQISIGPESVPYYFVELNDNGDDAVRYLGVTLQNPDATYVDLAQTMTATDVHVGDGTMFVDTDLAAGTFAGEAGWIGERYTVTAPTAGYPGGQRVLLVDNGLDLEVQWIAVIATN